MNSREFRHEAIELTSRAVTEAVTEIAALLEDLWRGTDREKDLALAEADLAERLLVQVQVWCKEWLAAGKTVVN